MGSVKATRQHIAQAAFFVLLFFGPLASTAFFPNSRFSQFIDSTRGAILLLAISAGVVSGVLAWALFRAKSE